MNSFKNQKWLVFILGMVLFSVIMTMMSKNSANNELTAASSFEQVDTEDGREDTEEIETFIYTADNYSMNIPSGWTKVIQNGYDTFIHQPTGTSVQIQELDYDPTVNNATADLLSMQIAQEGNTFVNFLRVTDCQYELVYQDYQTSTYDYIEEVYWDREKIIRLVFIADDQYYDRMQSYFQTVVDSFAWDRQDPIPDGCVLSYSETGDFEFCVPDTWVYGDSSDTIYCYDQDSGSNVTITLSEYTDSLEKLTANEMASAIIGNKSNYIMQRFNTDKTSATAFATYLKDSVQISEYSCFFVNGRYLATATFDYEDGMIDETTITDCIGAFRFLHDYFPQEEDSSVSSSTDTQAEEVLPAQTDSADTDIQK